MKEKARSFSYCLTCLIGLPSISGKRSTLLRLLRWKLSGKQRQQKEGSNTAFI
jgi:hypothetical protein